MGGLLQLLEVEAQAEQVARARGWPRLEGVHRQPSTLSALSMSGPATAIVKRRVRAATGRVYYEATLTSTHRTSGGLRIGWAARCRRSWVNTCRRLGSTDTNTRSTARRERCWRLLLCRVWWRPCRHRLTAAASCAHATKRQRRKRKESPSGSADARKETAALSTSMSLLRSLSGFLGGTAGQPGFVKQGSTRLFNRWRKHCLCTVSRAGYATCAGQRAGVHRRLCRQLTMVEYEPCSRRELSTDLMEVEDFDQGGSCEQRDTELSCTGRVLRVQHRPWHLSYGEDVGQDVGRE